VNVALKTLIRAAILVLGAGLPAVAADLPMNAPPPMESPGPIYDWTGFYIGANGGFGWANGGHVRVDDPINGPYSIGLATRTGFLGGGQVGYNLQSDVLVSGIEADIQYANIGSTVHWGPYGFLGVSSGSHAAYFGTVRARAGFTVDRTLFFLTGGFAYGGLASPPLGGAPTVNVGFAVGGGVEYAFTNYWTVKAEALYIDLGKSISRTIFVTNGGIVYPITATSANSGDLVRVGVNYKF
jgi:outer membrane immunogenic protein